MSELTERRKREKKIAGERLLECIKMRGINQAKLVELVDSLGDETISGAYVSMVISGQRSMSYPRIMAASRALLIEAGYLLGDDGFVAENYFEYLEGKETNKLIIEDKRKKENSFREIKVHECFETDEGLFIKIDEDRAVPLTETTNKVISIDYKNNKDVEVRKVKAKLIIVE